MSVITKAVFISTLAVGANAFGYSSSCTDPQWNMFVEDDWMPYGTQDMTTGDMVGFHPDLVHLVCQAAGKECNIIGGTGANCVDSHQEIGAALRDNTADACVGWGHTVSRHRSGRFSEGWTAESSASLYAKKDSGLTADMPAGAKVGIITSWASDEGCLGRNGIVNSLDNVAYVPHHYQSASAALAALEFGEVHYVFGLDFNYSDQIMEVDTSAKPIMCFMDSFALFAPMRSTDLVNEWNKAFDMVKGGEQFKALCEKWGVSCKDF